MHSLILSRNSLILRTMKWDDETKDDLRKQFINKKKQPNAKHWQCKNQFRYFLNKKILSVFTQWKSHSNKGSVSGSLNVHLMARLSTQQLINKDEETTREYNIQSINQSTSSGHYRYQMYSGPTNWPTSADFLYFCFFQETSRKIKLIQLFF